MAQDVGADIMMIKGEELRDRGFGALYSVGKASVEPPYLVVLSHKPKDSEGKKLKKIAWVGKGIVFDTGGTLHQDSEDAHVRHETRLRWSSWRVGRFSGGGSRRTYCSPSTRDHLIRSLHFLPIFLLNPSEILQKSFRNPLGIK